MNRIFRSVIFYILLGAAVFWVFTLYRTSAEKPVKLDSVNQFVEYVEDGTIDSAEFLARDNKVTGDLSSERKYEITLPWGTLDTYANFAREEGVSVTADQQQGSPLLSILVQFLPILLILPFFSISGSDFVEMFVGVGASRVRDLFEQAKANAPSIVFMDEIDAVGRHRGAGLGGGHDEREQTLNQLLVEMDGFDIKSGVILIPAPNRPAILDPALLPPGRFDRQIVVDRPDLNGRTGILKVHTRGKPMSKEIDVEVLARRTPGFTGADLANVVNEAALLAARFNHNEIGMFELEEAIDRVLAGPQRRHLGSREEGHCVPRGRTCPRVARPSQRGPGAQGVDRVARARARVHADASDGGPLP